MSFVKKLKKMIALATLMIMSVSTAHAQFYSVPSELNSYGQKVYSTARTYFGRRSFSGYCGTYVKCQLRAMGIFVNQFDVNGNGNQWYSNFESVDKTSGGYSVYRESGVDCIYKLQEKYGDNLSNIVLSFPIQAGYSASRPGAGHAMVIYELRGNIAYYSESFGFGEYLEGEVVAEDIDALLERYSRRHGNVTGCVMLSREQLLSPIDQQERIITAIVASLGNVPVIPLVA